MKMNGYIFIGTGMQNSLLLFGTPTLTNEFVLITANKPLDTNMSEL
jgi:hypothetical protein